MRLERVVFLAAYTSRSLAYARAIAARELRPACVLLFGRPDQRNPDLEAVCAGADWDVERIEADDVNDPAITRRICELETEVAVYSGYGGQILRDEILDTPARFLHVHSGWLPEYRGSTTLYYSLLNESRCAASALVLDKDIDTGPIVARKHYAAPTSKTEVDHGYDGSIRADLMADVLEHYARTGALPEQDHQAPAVGTTYYVIHPVLKHVAMLSLAEEKAA